MWDPVFSFSGLIKSKEKKKINKLHCVSQVTLWAAVIDRWQDL